jgi:hypothetical protein
LWKNKKWWFFDTAFGHLGTRPADAPENNDDYKLMNRKALPLVKMKLTWKRCAKEIMPLGDTTSL